MPALTQSDRGGMPPVIDDFPPGGDENRDQPERGRSRSASLTGIAVLMCASTMTFAALVSAMVVRRGMNTDWRHVPLPAIVWWNTAALLVSSVLFDTARHLLRRNRRRWFNTLWTCGATLGVLFLAGQTTAWVRLKAAGFYLQGNPGSAFFYVFTWSHAAHVVGALAAVLYVEYRALRFQLGPGRRTFVDVSVFFWHFLGVLWLVILGLFAWWA